MIIHFGVTDIYAGFAWTSRGRRGRPPRPLWAAQAKLPSDTRFRRPNSAYEGSTLSVTLAARAIQILLAWEGNGCVLNIRFCRRTAVSDPSFTVLAPPTPWSHTWRHPNCRSPARPCLVACVWAVPGVRLRFENVVAPLLGLDYESGALVKIDPLDCGGPIGIGERHCARTRKRCSRRLASIGRVGRLRAGRIARSKTSNSLLAPPRPRPPIAGSTRPSRAEQRSDQPRHLVTSKRLRVQNVAYRRGVLNASRWREAAAPARLSDLR